MTTSSTPSTTSTVSTVSTISNPESHAIVIGGSIAGLLAAQVLTEHYAQVTIVERDRLLVQPEFRKGVPQAKHAHVLLRRGLDILEQFFPGLSEELRQAGAVDANIGSDLRWHAFGTWRRPYRSAMMVLACSRPLLESSVYRRVAANPKINVVHETAVTGLLADAAGSHVRGVRVKPRGEGPGAEYTIEAQLVVDASGRDSDAPKWLQALGYAAPRETSVNSHAAYISRVFKMPAKAQAWKALYVQPFAPNQPRGGIILPMEGGQWHVTLFTIGGGEYPPNEDEKYLEFARSLPTLEMYEALSQAEPVSPVIGYRRGENRLRHYDELTRYLDGFIVFGDSVYALNPVYGQGMTVAAMGALAFADCLRETRQRQGNDVRGLAARFQKALGKVIASPWQLATGEDLRWPRTETTLALDTPTRIIQAYMGKVLLASMTNIEVAETFYTVQQMIAPPTVVFHPKIIWHAFTTPPPQAELRAATGAARNPAQA